MLEWQVGDPVILEVVERAAENEGLSEDETQNILNQILGETLISPKKVAKKVAKTPIDLNTDVLIRSGFLKFKKGSKWVKANFKLTDSSLSYNYTEEGIGDFGETIPLSAKFEASAGSDQAPGALRNYSFKLANLGVQTTLGIKFNSLHMLAAKQPEVKEWLSAIMTVCNNLNLEDSNLNNNNNGVKQKNISGEKKKNLAKKSLSVNSKNNVRAGSQPPVRIERSGTRLKN